MKRKIFSLLGFLSLFSSGSVLAQDYEQLTVASGYNADVIANGSATAAASTTMSVDNASWSFMSTDFAPPGMPSAPTSALPLGGVIQSDPTPGLSYQLGDYDSDNSLRIHGTTAPAVTSGTLTFTNQVNATKIYVLTTSGSGVATISTTINFTDATSQTITGSTVPDWYFSNLLPVAASGFGRVNLENNTIENPTGNPRMYQLMLSVDTENQAKFVESIEFTKTSTTEGVVNVFAVSAEILSDCPSPGDVSADTGVSDATINWSEPAILPDMGYDYYYSTETTEPDALTVPTGNIDSGETTVTLSDLAIGETYYFWVRSACDTNETGVWMPVVFTTGQVTTTYDDGVIETLYNSSPSASSTSSCPGIMTVSIPDGYEISDVATSYSMSTASNGYKSEQRSKLVCTTISTSETSLSSGTGTGGTQQYNRTGLTFANGATGDVEFELHAWRTYGGSGCNTTWNKVDADTWTLTVTYECSTPLTPQAIDQTFCSASTVADLVATTDYENATLRWYADETGGDQLTNETALTSGTYYVSQYRYTCESERQAVEVTMATAILPVTEITQTFCSGSAISDLYAEGATDGVISWYATADSEDILTDDIAIETGSYFVTQTLNGCESERIEVAVTSNTTDIPTANAAQTYCSGSMINELLVDPSDNATLNWYATADSEDILNDEDMLQSGSYFVSQTLNGCEGERMEIAVTVNDTPDAPLGDAIQEYDAGDTLASLTVNIVTGAVVNWYILNDEMEFVAVDATTELEDGTVYYASQTLNNCESEYFAITANEALSSAIFDRATLKVYPNPASDIITISDQNTIENITIVDLLGQTVIHQEGNTDKMQLDISKLAAGTYILQINVSEGHTATVKIIKQ